ncbi:MAG: hypothetical protein ACLTSZ_05550 [Lachnospiraceae bacterium]
MAEETKSNEKKAKKRTNKLTNARIKKEIEFLTPMFAGIDDEDKKSLVNSLVEEAAFLKVACFQAKEELKKRAYHGNGKRFTEICKSPPVSHDLREIFTPIYGNYSHAY